jgi:Family of unknown function (DUF6913)
MELFRNLRIRVGRSMLSGKISKMTRKPQYISYCNIKHIGVVWDASRPEEFAVLSKFRQKMSEQNIDVQILGYYPGRNLPDQYTAKQFLNCLKRNEIDFFYRPLAPLTDDFLRTRFDVLIDINFRKQFPLEYISTLSAASLKVGLADSKPESSPFEMMISLKNPVKIEQYLEHVLFYLEMINSEPAKQAV